MTLGGCDSGNDVASCERSLLRGSSMDMEKAISHIVDVQVRAWYSGIVVG